ncbi:exodeoxyribonuclease VII large subunit [bacterium]|nr:exodeoxyribonuclease VII large subunit [bacterium]
MTGERELYSKRLTITELTRIIKMLLEESIPTIKVEGEVSNYVHHASGHRYFTLKDENCQIKCVMFKWQAVNIDFAPGEGMKVEALGNVTVYERGGQYQFNVIRLMPLGRGELLARMEELKKKLAAEGLFDNNRPLPLYPATVGVVTSPTGAAIRDIITVMRRRAPHVRIILRPALVQGEGAAADIAQGIGDLNGRTDVEVIIVGRGGGSIEDLWCFNEETVARAIAGSRIPVVSAVGHEIDFTIADFAADVRAPTPSAAAEIVVRNTAEVKQEIAYAVSRLRQGVLGKLDDLTARVSYVRKGLSADRFIDMLSMKSQTVDEMTMRMKGALTLGLARRETALERLKSTITAMNPRAVLTRGYSIVYLKRDERVVNDRSMVKPGDGITVELARGRLDATVEGTYD